MNGRARSDFTKTKGVLNLLSRGVRAMGFAPDQKVFVYVVAQVGGEQPWKIGRTTDPKQRLASLQAGSPVPLAYVKITEVHPTLEYSIHRQFSRYRIHGEWFDLPSEEQQKVLARLDGEPWVYKVLRKNDPEKRTKQNPKTAAGKRRGAPKRPRKKGGVSRPITDEQRANVRRNVLQEMNKLPQSHIDDRVSRGFMSEST